MLYELTIHCDFEAAHCLPDYPGKCRRLHGHNWQVEVTITGNQLDEMGMLMDFKVFKQEVNSVLDTLDHYYLNELEPFKNMKPTAENIARYLFENISDRPAFAASGRGLRITRVKIWESPHSAASYFLEEK